MTNAQWKYILATLTRLEEAIDGIRGSLESTAAIGGTDDITGIWEGHTDDSGSSSSSDGTSTGKLYNRRVAE